MTGKSTIIGLEDFFEVRGELLPGKTGSPENSDESNSDESQESGASKGHSSCSRPQRISWATEARPARGSSWKDVKRRMNILRWENAALDAKIYELEEEKIQLIKIEEERDALS